MKDNIVGWVCLGIILTISTRESFGQELRLITELPTVVYETSGIETSSPNEIWTFNDSGGDPVLYLCDTAGQLVHSVFVLGAQNRDWEDIAQDDLGNIYIGDMGNNANDREDLRIYKVPPPDLATDTVVATLIEFRYADQRSFPPPGDSLNFDSESLFWFRDHLYLCTKNRTSPFDGVTYLYRIPDTLGVYVAEKMGVFHTGGSTSLNSWITAADISQGGRLCLLTSDKIWIFSDFEEDHFFEGSHMAIELGTLTQKEAICFVNDSLLYITDEEWIAGIGRNLYAFEIGDVSTKVNDWTRSTQGVSIFPNPCRDVLRIAGELKNFEIEVYGIDGKKVEIFNRSENLAMSDLNGFSSSIFFVRILEHSSGKSWAHKIVKME